MINKDIRWQQRFNNFKKAFEQLERFTGTEKLNEMESQGLIKAFEYTYELSWKTLQDLLKYKGYNNILGPRPVIEKSFQDGYITNGNAWMSMQQSRSLTSHTYDAETAEEVIEEIKSVFFDLFKELRNVLEEEITGKQHALFNE